MGMTGHNYGNCKKCGKQHINGQAGKNAWNRGLTKETSEIIAKNTYKCGHDYKGSKNPFFGKNHKESSKKLIMESWGKPEVRYRKIENMKKTLSLPEKKEQRRKISKELWQTDIYREKTIKSMLSSLFKRPTSYEQKLVGLIKKYTLPYKYVGNGEFILAGKNPDFINTNGEKIVIEVYEIAHLGIFKSINYELERSQLFAKYGYKTKFITGKELFDDDWEQICLTKLQEVN